MSVARIERVLREHDALHFPLPITMRVAGGGGAPIETDGIAQSVHDILELVRAMLNRGATNVTITVPPTGFVLFHVSHSRWHLPDRLVGPPPPSPRPPSPGVD